MAVPMVGWGQLNATVLSKDDKGCLGMRVVNMKSVGLLTLLASCKCLSMIHIQFWTVLHHFDAVCAVNPSTIPACHSKCIVRFVMDLGS